MHRFAHARSPGREENRQDEPCDQYHCAFKTTVTAFQVARVIHLWRMSVANSHVLEMVPPHASMGPGYIPPP